MLLRRITEHVKAQNWFAVGLDFLIVVFGVFIGIQVANWNDAQRVQALEQSYISRVADDLKFNIAAFEDEIISSAASRSALERFMSAIADPATPDDELVEATEGYLSDGVFLAKFRPTRATFEELKSTGNLDIIRDRQMREALISLDTLYDRSNESFMVNLDWVLPADADYYLRFDALRYDSRTAALFAAQSNALKAQDIRDHQDIMARHAAIHYWLKDRAVDVLSEAIDETSAVHDLLEASP